MIGLGKSISHTRASMGYGWDQEKDAKVVYREHLAGDNPKEITQEFKIIQSQNHKCKKNTLSFVLSPTIEDGRELKDKELKEITKRFVKEMKLQERQAIAFVHQDKSHLHIHLYVNRIGFDGKAYKDNYIGKRSQLAAKKVAQQMGLTTVREVQQQKLNRLKEVRSEIKQIHEKVITKMKPKDFDQYIGYMKQSDVKVIPSINRSNRLQGFRFKYKGHSLKGSEVHRSMSGTNLVQQIEPTMAKEMHLGNLNRIKNVKMEIKKIHQRVITVLRPENFNQYSEYMKQKEVMVTQPVNKIKQLQVFKFEYKGHSLTGSEIGLSTSLTPDVEQINSKPLKESQPLELIDTTNIKMEIKKIHEKIITELKPKDFDQYIKYMNQNDVKVIPNINKSNQLQGFRFEFKGYNLMGSEVNRSMSIGKIAERIGLDSTVTQEIVKDNTINLLGKTVGLSPNLAATIAKKAIKLAVKKSIGLGMEI